MVWFSHHFKFFEQFVVIPTDKGFGLKNEAEVVVFVFVFVFKISCFFNDLVDVVNLIFHSSPFSKSSLNMWKFIVHELLKPGLENFEHYVSTI